MVEKIADQVVVKRLSNKEEMLQAYEIIKQRYSEMKFETYENNLSEMMDRNDFTMIAAFLNDKIVGVSGYWIQRMLYCGRYLQLSSFIVDEEKRGLGVGKKILDEVKKVAKEQGCERVVLDSFTENKKSHALYFREGFHIRGLHFMYDL